MIEKYLKAGAIVIGEQKFRVECDSPESQVLYALAAEYRVPILLHFQHEAYNLGFDRFHKMLEKYPKTVFIGHAQTWWANIDRNHADQKILYPKGKVTAGGLTDRYLSDYPNAYADMSAGSGLHALTRDEDHARGFLHAPPGQDPLRERLPRSRRQRRRVPGIANDRRDPPPRAIEGHRAQGPFRECQEVVADLIRDSIPGVLFADRSSHTSEFIGADPGPLASAG